MRIESLLLAVLVASLAAGCSKPDSENTTSATIDPSPVLATVNGEPITRSAVEHLMEQLQRPVHSDPHKARALVIEELIRRRLLAQYAAQHQLDRDLDVFLSLERQREAILAGAARRQILEGTPVITEDELRRRYAQQIEQGPKAEHRVRHIILETEEAARQAIAEIEGGRAFEDVARERSTGPTRDQGGELGWLRPGMVVPEFFAAVEKLEPGAHTASPVRTTFGWHVIKLEQTRPLTPAPFDQVKDQIQTMLRQQQFEEKIEELRARAEITLTEDTPATEPPAEAPSR